MVDSEFLVSLYFYGDDAFTQEHREQLSNWLQQSPENMSQFVRAAYLHQAVHEHVANRERILLEESALDKQNFDYAYWTTIGEHEKMAPAIPKEESRPELIQKVVYPPQVKRKMAKIQKLTFAACAAVIMFFVYLHFAPLPSSSIEVATLVDQMDVQWGQSWMALDTGSRLWTNQGRLSLQKGIINILYDDGVSVLVEGPASFEIDQSRLWLDYGRLYSRVSGTGLGFTVKTPTSQFIDMGTEFGVQADVNGSSELHVMKGNVQLFAGTGNAGKFGKMTTQGHAVRYDSYHGHIQDIPIKTDAFIRTIDSKKQVVWRGQEYIDLADIVGGGNGFGTGKYGYIVDQLSGNIIPKPTIYPNNQIRKKSDYTVCNSSPFIDGVFVPDGENGPVQISTRGDLFPDCPDTSGECWIGIQNGTTHQIIGEIKEHFLSLNGVEYGTPQKAGVFLHANQGITFDLEQIRQSVPFANIDRFTSLCGLSDTIYEPSIFENGKAPYSREASYSPPGHFWVLVDGELRFSTIVQSPLDNAVSIDVPISAQDRFLTIAATDINKDYAFVWTLFAEPKLHLSNMK